MAENNSRVWRMFHERYCVCACSVAATEWSYRGKSHFSTDNSIGMMEPGEIHRVTSTRCLSNFKAFFIDREVVSEIAVQSDLSGAQHLRVAQLTDGALFAALDRAALAIQSAESPLDQQAKFIEFLVRLLGYAEKAPSSRDIAHNRTAIRRASDLLRARFHDSISLTELAKAVNLSRFHLVRSFSREMGLPPHAYQVHVRIEQAGKLLREGLAPVQVATSVGFADQSHFTRHFKKIMKVTPSAYVQAVASQEASGR